ncbi:hypothetical protein D3C83_170410 [compost metagenome]
MCKTLLRNDYWCKGLGQTQPKSDAWLKFKEMRKAAKDKERTANKQQARETKRLARSQEELFEPGQ